MSFTSARADRIAAVVFAGLGLAMLVGGYQMDRLEIRQIHPASIPGLVPMILGAALTVCAVFLHRSAGKDAAVDQPAAGASDDWVSFLFTAGYCVAYALVLVGNMPFALATALFIATFVIHFTYDHRRSLPARAVTVATALAFAIAAALAIAALFRHAFLVRLP